MLHGLLIGNRKSKHGLRNMRPSKTLGASSQVIWHSMVYKKTWVEPTVDVNSNCNITWLHGSS